LLAPLAHDGCGVKVARGAALSVAYLNRLLNFAELAAKLVVNKDFHFTRLAEKGPFGSLFPYYSRFAMRLPRMDWGGS
jgi:hypothetical protein